MFLRVAEKKYSAMFFNVWRSSSVNESNDPSSKNVAKPAGDTIT